MTLSLVTDLRKRLPHYMRRIFETEASKKDQDEEQRAKAAQEELIKRKQDLATKEKEY